MIKKEKRMVSDSKGSEWWELNLFGKHIKLTTPKEKKYFAAESWQPAVDYQVHDFVGCEGYIIGQTGARYSGYVVSVDRYKVMVNFRHVDFTKWIRKSRLQKLKLTYFEELSTDSICNYYHTSEKSDEVIAVLWLSLKLFVFRKSYVISKADSDIYIVSKVKDVLRAKYRWNNINKYGTYSLVK